MEKPYTWQWVSSLFFSHIVIRMFSLFHCFQKPFMPDKMKCQTWQLTSKHSMYILLKTVSSDYKLFRAETLSCNCVACAIHIYESIEELVIIIMCDATDGLNGSKKTNANSVLPHAPCQGKNTVSVFIFREFTDYGRKDGVACQWDLLSLPLDYQSSLRREGSWCCTLELDVKTVIIFEAVWFPKP